MIKELQFLVSFGFLSREKHKQLHKAYVKGPKQEKEEKEKE